MQYKALCNNTSAVLLPLLDIKLMFKYLPQLSICQVIYEGCKAAKGLSELKNLTLTFTLFNTIKRKLTLNTTQRQKYLFQIN